MSGSKSPAPASAPAEENQQNDATNATTNGHRSPDAETAEPAKVVNGSPKRSIEQDDGSELPDAPPPATNGFPSGPTEGDEDANSEAETVLTSPVKKREAEKRVEAIKQEKPDQPALPAPAAVKEEEDAEDDDDADAPGSPDDSAVPTSAAPANKANLQDRADGRLNKSRDRSSEPLSDVSPTRSGTGQSSRASSNSRAQSERPDSSSKHDNKESPNPRKRKHRASSVNLPNKRPSMDVAKRRLRDLHSEGVAGGNTTARSPSPSRRGHRRAVSTQSAILDGSSDAQGNRKRRAVTQFPVREPKAAKTTWEDSSVSSEATSHGQGEVPRRQRGIGRSTSTPGRPPGREHKRHINKYGFTKLAEACEDGDLELVKEWRHKDPDQLEIEEFAKNTPLQIASLNGNSEVVEYLIGEGCRIDCYNVDKDTPLIDAAENGHADVVDILLNAGVDPLRQNLKGQQALDVVNDDTENAAEIRASLRKAMEKWNSVDARKRREHEEEQRFSSRPSGELHFMARTYENLHKLVVNNDRNSVREFLDARVPVDNNIIAAAAKTGDSYLINMLLAEMTEKKAFQKPEKPLLSVLGTSHLETVKSLTELDQFNPLWRNRQGKTWPEIADERHGPMWKQESELLHRLYNEAREKADRRSSSPVTKRDEVKRRPPPQSGDNSEDESPPKRKNGKRLMSRREMRAASGKPFSDSSSDESSSETAREAEESMKPPESPNTKRGPGRPRKSSTSSQPADLPQEVARTRRRSSSVREKAEPTLPIVDEQMEDVDAAADAKPEEKADAERTEAAANSASTPENTKAKEEAAKKAEEDAKKKAEDEAKEAFEAEALKREDEARKKEEEESKARKAEEDARKAAEEKRADEQRQAEEAKLREEEEARKAESARKAEEQRKRLERELSEAKSKHRQELASSLPTALARTLDPALDENEQSRMAIEALEAFTPLQVLPFANASSDDSGPKLRTELFVLNAQAAPLLGKVGLDLLLRQDAPGFEDSLAHTWKSLPLDDADRDCVQAILPSHILVSEPVDEDEDMLAQELSFEAELSRRARQVHSAQEAQSKLERANLELRWVKLQDVLDNLHPVLRDAPIDLRTDVRRPQDHARTLKSIQASNTPDFFGRVSEWWKQSSLPHAIQNGKAAMHPQWSVGTTEVRVSHEK